MPLWVRGRLWAVMCYNVRVWMMVKNHMLVPSVGQININHHQLLVHMVSSTRRVLRLAS